MTALHALNQAHAEQIVADGFGWVFLDGICGLCIEGGMEAHDYTGRPHVGDVPPLEFVEACQPCDNKYHTFYLHDVGDNGCPDCHNGRRRCELVVPCCHNQATCRDFSRPHCAWRTDGTADGLVTVATVVAVGEPLPVVDRIGNVTTNEAVVLGANSMWHVKQLGDNSEEQRINLPPDVDPQSLVGQWALRVEVV